MQLKKMRSSGDILFLVKKVLEQLHNRYQVKFVNMMDINFLKLTESPFHDISRTITLFKLVYLNMTLERVETLVKYVAENSSLVLRMRT